MDGKAERRWLGTSPCDNERAIALRTNALGAYEGKSSELIPPGPRSRVATPGSKCDHENNQGIFRNYQIATTIQRIVSDHENAKTLRFCSPYVHYCCSDAKTHERSLRFLMAKAPLVACDLTSL